MLLLHSCLFLSRVRVQTHTTYINTHTIITHGCLRAHAGHYHHHHACGLPTRTQAAEKELTIHNQGKVPFDFRVNTEGLSRPGIVEPIPRSGVVAPGQKLAVKLKLSPVVPEKLSECFAVEIAHFEPVSNPCSTF